jgi:hypothetical protein
MWYNILIQCGSIPHEVFLSRVVEGQGPVKPGNRFAHVAGNGANSRQMRDVKLNKC